MTIRGKVERLERNQRGKNTRCLFVFGEVSAEEIDRRALAAFGTTHVGLVRLPALSEDDANP